VWHGWLRQQCHTGTDALASCQGIKLWGKLHAEKTNRAGILGLPWEPRIFFLTSYRYVRLYCRITERRQHVDNLDIHRDS